MPILAVALGDALIAVQVAGAAIGSGLGLAAYLRSGKAEERSASQGEVDRLWAENRALRGELRTVRRETRQEIAAVRAEAIDREAGLRRAHEQCERELATLKAQLA